MDANQARQEYVNELAKFAAAELARLAINKGRQWYNARKTTNTTTGTTTRTSTTLSRGAIGMDIVPRRAPSYYGSRYRRRRKTPLYKRVRRLERLSERKYINISINDTILSAGPLTQFNLLNGMLQGTSVSQRTGNNIFIKYVNIRVKAVAGGAETGFFLRLGVVQDRQPNGAAPAATDIWTVDDLLSNRQLNKSERFKIWADSTLDSVADSRVLTWIRYINMRDMKTQYMANAGTVADISKNSLYFYCNAASIANNLTVAGYARVCYYDI